MKTQIYEMMSKLNRSFEQVVDDFRKLDALNVFPHDFLSASQSWTEELRASTNRKLTEILNLYEIQDAARFEKIRTAWQEAGSAPEPGQSGSVMTRIENAVQNVVPVTGQVEK